MRRKHLAPLTPNQKRYLDSIRKHDIVFAIGPAGTGKTFLAVAMAVARLVEGQVSRIILVRPAVEAGEKLGFLPGDIAAKFNPYVRPLYDALYEMLDPERMKAFIEDGIIEIAPLAYMRGRTLNSSFIILDEAQNTSIEQMKMFLTRLGLDSQAVVTGDITQIDLPAGKTSGLIHSQKILRNVPGIDFVEFTGKDVVRHSLVQKIIQAYEKHG
jgi:phosphate starvation-inducible PhoH-like protein